MKSHLSLFTTPALRPSPVIPNLRLERGAKGFNIKDQDLELTSGVCISCTLRSVCVCVCARETDRQTERSLRCPGPHTKLISVLFGDNHGVVSKQSLKHPNSSERECFMSTHFSFPSARVIPWPSHYAHLFMLILC